MHNRIQQLGPGKTLKLVVQVRERERYVVGDERRSTLPLSASLNRSLSLSKKNVNFPLSHPEAKREGGGVKNMP